MIGKVFTHLRQQWLGALAVVLVLTGGTAYALNGSNTVFSDDIVNNEVRSADLRDANLTTADIRADAVTTGKIANGTIRDEEYDVPRVPIVVVSRSADVPPTLAEAPPGRVLMATVETSDGLAQARETLGEENVLVLGEEQIDLVALKPALAERGWTAS